MLWEFISVGHDMGTLFLLTAPRTHRVINSRVLLNALSQLLRVVACVGCHQINIGLGILLRSTLDSDRGELGQ